MCPRPRRSALIPLCPVLGPPKPANPGIPGAGRLAHEQLLSLTPGSGNPDALGGQSTNHGSGGVYDPPVEVSLYPSIPLVKVALCCS